MKKIILFLIVIISMTINASAQKIHCYETYGARNETMEKYIPYKSYIFIDLKKKIVLLGDSDGSISFYIKECIEFSNRNLYYLINKEGGELQFIVKEKRAILLIDEYNWSSFYIKESTEEIVRKHLDISN